MEATELLETIARGEDSRHQFKQDVTNAASLAAEFVAFANSGGGNVYIGVTDEGIVRELDQADVTRINQLISNAASTLVRPAINPSTENIAVGGGVVIVVSLSDGLGKPYTDNNGVIWVKSGPDKRRVTAREEIQRMFQSAQLVHGDDVPLNGSSAADIDLDYFRNFFRAHFQVELEEQELSLTQVLTNMRLLSDGRLTVAGALLFARDPTPLAPAFVTKAVCYPGEEVHSSHYLDSSDITGRLDRQFKETLGFVTRNLRRQQNGQNVNAAGQIEIPQIVLEELIANALIHRDFFISAPVRVFVYSNRVEIISPGHLPNSLTVENIRSGTSNMRNPSLASYATKVLPYRGLGNGIIRALQEYPTIEFIDDREKNLFIAVVARPETPGT